MAVFIARWTRKGVLRRCAIPGRTKTCSRENRVLITTPVSTPRGTPPKPRSGRPSDTAIMCPYTAPTTAPIKVNQSLSLMGCGRRRGGCIPSAIGFLRACSLYHTRCARFAIRELSHGDHLPRATPSQPLVEGTGSYSSLRCARSAPTGGCAEGLDRREVSVQPSRQARYRASRQTKTSDFSVRVLPRLHLTGALVAAAG